MRNVLFNYCINLHSPKTKTTKPKQKQTNKTDQNQIKRNYYTSENELTGILEFTLKVTPELLKSAQT